ncbi:MAG: TlpA family protein disulfide reductase [Bdellovibrionales bacterium]|nr:TlpA family protein disulfide reductase [Bdellovibrionales bacterium]
MSVLGSQQAQATCSGPVAPLAGACAPDITIHKLDGTTVRLSDLRGKVVFLNFWATWCQPCVAEMPAMQKAYEKLGSKDFVMLAISLDDSKEQIEAFVKNKTDQKISFTLALNPGRKASTSFGSEKVPETFIIDKSGFILDKVLGYRYDWSESLFIHYLQLLKAQ